MISSINHFCIEQKKIANWKDETIQRLFITIWFIWIQKGISENYTAQENLIYPGVWKCIILKNNHNVQNKILK